MEKIYKACDENQELKPEMKEGNPIRLYSLDEITEIFGKLGLRICNSLFSNLHQIFIFFC